MEAGRWIRQAAGLLALCLAGVVHAGPTIGAPPPVDLIGATPEGERIRISDHRGKVVVVSFWASWCGYCRRQFPLLDHLQKEAGRERLRVVLVNHQESPSDYRKIRRALRASTVTWTHDPDGALSDAFEVRGVPHMLVFDKAGDLAAVRSGYSGDPAPTIELLNALLAEPAPSAPRPDGPTGPVAGDGG